MANIADVALLSGPGVLYSYASSISNNGYIAGTILLSQWNGPAYSGGIWDRDGTLSIAQNMDVRAVNSSGVMTGSANYQYWQRAFTASASAMTYLDLVGTGHESRGMAINDRGQVAGYSSTLEGGTPHAVRWDGATATDLGTLGGRFSYGFGINETGAVVGSSRPDPYSCCDDHATLWNSDGTVVDLGRLVAGSGDSAARGINDLSDAVGYARFGQSNYQAVLWHQGAATLLDTLAGSAYSEAYDINNRGQIVGTSSTGATLWQDGKAQDLNTLMSFELRADGWRLSDAVSINDSGWIVGSAWNSKTNQISAYLLRTSAVPEPTTSAMLFMGLLAILVIRRRNRYLDDTARNTCG